jgi:hypothetical protein
MEDSVTVFRGLVKLNDLDESIIWEEYLYIKDSDTQIDQFVSTLFAGAGSVPIVLRVKNVELQYDDDIVCVCDNVIVSLPKNGTHALHFPDKVIVGRPDEDRTQVTETNNSTNTETTLELNTHFLELFTTRIPDAFAEDCALVYIEENENSTEAMLAYKSDVPVVITK